MTDSEILNKIKSDKTGTYLEILVSKGKEYLINELKKPEKERFFKIEKRKMDINYELFVNNSKLEMNDNIEIKWNNEDITQHKVIFHYFKDEDYDNVYHAKDYILIIVPYVMTGLKSTEILVNISNLYIRKIK